MLEQVRRVLGEARAQNVVRQKQHAQYQLVRAWQQLVGVALAQGFVVLAYGPAPSSRPLGGRDKKGGGRRRR